MAWWLGRGQRCPSEPGAWGEERQAAASALVRGDLPGRADPSPVGVEGQGGPAQLKARVVPRVPGAVVACQQGGGASLRPALSMGALAEAFLPVQVTRSTCSLPRTDTEASEALELTLPSRL